MLVGVAFEISQIRSRYLVVSTRTCWPVLSSSSSSNSCCCCCFLHLLQLLTCADWYFNSMSLVLFTQLAPPSQQQCGTLPRLPGRVPLALKFSLSGSSNTMASSISAIPGLHSDSQIQWNLQSHKRFNPIGGSRNFRLVLLNFTILDWKKFARN